SGDTPRHEVRNGAFVSTRGVQIGDGIVFDEGHPEQDEQGGRVVAVRQIAPQTKRRNGREQFLELTFDRAAVNPRAVAVGATVWKTDDPAVRRRLAQSF